MEDIINDSEDKNLVPLNEQNSQSNSIWYFLSIFSWFILLCLQFDQIFKGINHFNLIIIFEKMKIPVIDPNFFYNLATSRLFTFLRTFIFGISLFGFIIYLIFTTTKKDENLLNSMMSKWTKFHFIPFILISALYISLKLELFKERLPPIPLASTLSLILVFSFLGCASLIFIYIITNLPCEWYIVFTIKKGCFSCLIAFSWFLFNFSLPVIILFFSKIRYNPSPKPIIALFSFFILFNNLGIIIFSFIFKDLVVLITHLLIYKEIMSIVISQFGLLIKEIPNFLAAGITSLVIVFLIFVEIIILSTVFKDKLFK